jgi:hypothetical protein
VAVAIGAEGYVAVAGTFTNAEGGPDFGVVTLVAIDGSDRLGGP